MERFWAKTVRRENGCLEWIGGKSEGYGVFNYNGEPIRTHVVAWKLYKGRWPLSGKFICHSCDNRPCVEETHLFEDYPRGNSQDASFKGRMGRKNKLTWHERNLVRLSLQDGILTQREIAEVFGTSQATVRECKFFLHEAKL